MKLNIFKADLESDFNHVAGKITKMVQSLDSVMERAAQQTHDLDEEIREKQSEKYEVQKVRQQAEKFRNNLNQLFS